MNCIVTPLEPEDLELLYTIENNPDIGTSAEQPPHTAVTPSETT